MIECEFRRIGGVNRCVRCGFVDVINIHEPENVHRDCDVQSLPLHRLAWSFTKAWARYWLYGRPATEEHLRAQRLATCKGCEHYKDAGCVKCGCPVTDRPKWLADKLSMATERCPLNPPKWGRAELAPSLGFVGRLARMRAWWAERRLELRKFWWYARPRRFRGPIRPW